MLARKPFKGGNLDDFLAAGEAEAKYGPKRYAAVSEDAWKIRVEQTQSEEQRALSLQRYEEQKGQILSDHLLLSALGVAAFWGAFSEPASLSYAGGAALGAFYLFLKSREADSLGASSLEEVRSGPPAIVVPVLLVLIVSKYKALMLLPALAGFFTTKIATVGQLLYVEPESAGE